jgi:hypothetical protein
MFDKTFLNDDSLLADGELLAEMDHADTEILKINAAKDIIMKKLTNADLFRPDKNMNSSHSPLSSPPKSIGFLKTSKTHLN